MVRDLLDVLAESWSTAIGLCCNTQTKTSSMFSTSTRQYQILHSLGEGGFSHVVLVKDHESGEHFAAKKMLCHRGMDTYAMAQREMDAYRRFHHHRNIIPMLDSVVFDDDFVGRSNSKAVYMVFPVYRRGNLLDLVMHNQEEEEEEAGGSRLLDELFIIGVFRGICDAVSYLHSYADTDEHEQQGYAPLQATADDSSSRPVTPYAHRDIKLANVMLADDGQTPILMDFGSCLPARFTAHTRQDALRIQDDAAESCSMAYRAPELFDVQTGAEFDERTDVWSLGCLLFALAYSHTPFEEPLLGGLAGTSSILLAAINRKYSFPASNPYSPRLKQIIDFMLEPDPKRRPFIDQVIALTRALYP
ncbi:Serine/threonine-protein kinase env7 [Coemansia sp. RSA 1694]|nr:Serine/threonine-protein kinase env7 [Coemansia sp. RSA 1694]